MTLQKYFEDEHEQLDELLAELEHTLTANQVAHARQSLARFAGKLDRYIRGEELLLFPVFDQLAETAPVPTRAMREEHERLLQMATSISRCIERNELAVALAMLRKLRSVYLLHNVKEDGVIYPLVALAVPRASHDTVIQHLKVA
jgi:iron-sulfur cluster repair protein YtfE (RIC family)